MAVLDRRSGSGDVDMTSSLPALVMLPTATGSGPRRLRVSMGLGWLVGPATLVVPGLLEQEDLDPKQAEVEPDC